MDGIEITPDPPLPTYLSILLHAGYVLPERHGKELVLKPGGIFGSVSRGIGVPVLRLLWEYEVKVAHRRRIRG